MWMTDLSKNRYTGVADTGNDRKNPGEPGFFGRSLGNDYGVFAVKDHDFLANGKGRGWSLN